MRIINCLPYFNERELLELRLNLLKDVVDHFYITEGTLTHSGEPKEMTCQKVVDELGFTSKVTVITVNLPDKNATQDNWARENMQRDAAASPVIIDRDSVAFITDADEIPNPDFVKYYANAAWNNPLKIVRIPMAFLNNRADFQVMESLNGKPRQWRAPFVCLRYHTQRYNLSSIRESFTRGTPKIDFESVFLTDSGQVLDAGWHFSWMGTNATRLTKWNAYAEKGGNIPGAHPETGWHVSNHRARVNSTDPLGRLDHVLSFYHWDRLPKKLFELPRVKQFLLPTKIDHFYFEPHMGESWFTFPNLYRSMVESAPQTGAKFVEVGVWKGRSASFMATEIANSGKDIAFYCVDHWKGSVEHQNNPELKDLYEIYKQNMKPVDGLYLTIRDPSLVAARRFEDESLDFVFIDASHEYEDVKADIRAWLPKMKKGGILAGHDYYPRNPEFGGVTRAVDEVLAGSIVASEDCWMHIVGSKIQNPDSLQYKLESYIQDPDDADRNFNLGCHYAGIGQLASAVSFFIRAAERTSDELLQYESMIRAALCFIQQGTRGLSVRGLLLRAMTILPYRPEAYFLLARWYEREGQVESWVNCYTYASMAEKICDFSLPPLRTWVEYPGKYGILFEKAVSGWWVGQCEEARDTFIDLIKNHNLDQSHKQSVINNLKFMESTTGRKLLPE